MKNFKRLTTKSDRSLLLWGGILTVIVFLAVFANVFATHNPPEVNLKNVFSSPSANNVFGTDNMGRDIYSRILYGGRISLSVSILSVLLSTVVGTLFGGISGYIGGWWDSLMMRILEALLAIPTLIIMMALQAITRGGTVSLILIIGLTGWMTTARIVRSQFMELKEKEFVKAAHILGTPAWKILVNHLLRNSLSAIFVISIFNCAHAVFTEVFLSFLGIGIPPQTPSWGNMLNNAQNDMLIGAWWGGVFPGLMIGTIRALSDVSFVIKHNEIVGIVGESGCGKSTLSRQLVKLENLTSGRIIFQGENIKKFRT